MVVKIIIARPKATVKRNYSWATLTNYQRETTIKVIDRYDELMEVKNVLIKSRKATKRKQELRVRVLDKITVVMVIKEN